MTPPAPSTSPLPRITTALAPHLVLERLSTASRRGRLAGFAPYGSNAFTVAAHGSPFDGVLTGTCRDGSLEFSLRMLQRLPVIFAVVLLATIWPGVYFMDELVAQFLPSMWRPWVTYYWYLPLTAIPLPWMWRSLMRRSRAVMVASAREMIEKIALEVDGKVEDQPTPK